MANEHVLIMGEAFREALENGGEYAELAPRYRGLTDEECGIVMLAILRDQAAIDQCRWAVIQSLIERGYLVEVWPSMDAKYGEPVIRIAAEVNAAHQSTNRI